MYATEEQLLEDARRGSEDGFRLLVEPHRRAIQVHCYRMLGSLSDAEDATQDAFVRAWRHLGGFEGRSSLRAWLYSIATNVCLTAAARNRRRLLPEDNLDPLDPSQPPQAAEEVAWLGPYPDALLEHADDDADPARHYEERESVRLAFVAALQHLPARQRAALILKDVLGWSAAEVADLLESSVASVNSALQRARATLRTRVPPRAPTPDVEDLLSRYVRAWEAKDMTALVGLLKRDAIMSMPPYASWLRGREAIRSFLSAIVMAGRGPTRLERTEANGQPAYVTYERPPGHDEWLVLGIMVLTIDGDEISQITAFPDRSVAEAFLT